MDSKVPTKRELLLRQRAARIVERALPEQVGAAYGVVPMAFSALLSDDPQRVAVRENARASLLNQGVLTAEELDTLSADQAIEVALRRVRTRVASLQDQAEQQANQERSTSDRLDKPPRTLRQG